MNFRLPLLGMLNFVLLLVLDSFDTMPEGVRVRLGILVLEKLVRDKEEVNAPLRAGCLYI